MKQQPFNIRYAACLVALFLVLSSCVSSRKYNAALSENKNLEQRNMDLKIERERLLNEKEALYLAESEKARALNEKERSLREEENKMREMKALIDAQRAAIDNLKQQVCNALKCYTPDELSVEVRDGKLYVSLSDKLLFPSGSDVVNARGKEAIAMLAAVLDHSDLEIMVEGHTDNVPIHTGRNKDNWDLSVHRATSVTRLLHENGIATERIIPAGRGEYRPVAANATESGRQLNRRTEIVLAPRLEKLWELTGSDNDMGMIN